MCNKEKLKAGMSKITTVLKSGSGKSGVLFGVPDNRGFGGNTTTASIARKVFNSKQLINRIIDLLPENDLEMRNFFRTIFENDRKILGM